MYSHTQEHTHTPNHTMYTYMYMYMMMYNSEARTNIYITLTFPSRRGGRVP